MVRGLKGLESLDYPGGLDFKEFRNLSLSFAPGEKAALYVIGWSEKGPLKFGVARDPVVRLAELQTGNPHRLRIFAAWWLHSEPAAFATESACLEQVAPFRMAGEWAGVSLAQARQVARAVFGYFSFEPEKWRPTDVQAAARKAQFARDRKTRERAQSDAAAKEFEWLRNETRRR